LLRRCAARQSELLRAAPNATCIPPFAKPPRKCKPKKRAGKYQEALESIAGLRKVVDQFFDGVMVMAENEAVRANRLALLAELLREFTTVADFSEIGGEERR